MTPAFITTTAQSPAAGVHTISCGPVPAARATQNDSCPGSVAGAPPAVGAAGVLGWAVLGGASALCATGAR